jgi:hypothetical protein
MEFFNSKEDVLEIKLTQYGKFIYSKGKFKPTYYAFMDDDILYDGMYAGKTEIQNQIEPRIQEETPRLKTQVTFESTDSLNKLLTIEQINSENNLNKFVSLIGNSDLGVQANPIWKVNTLYGGFDSTLPFITGSNRETIQIPQLNSTIKAFDEIKYLQTAINELKQQGITRVTQHPNFEFGLSNGGIFDDQSVIDITTNSLLMKIVEENAQSLFDSYELSVFDIIANSDGSESYKKLKFALNNHMDNIEPQSTQDLTVTKDNVEYYFTINTDTNINNLFICTYILKDRNNVDEIFKDFDICKDTITRPRNSLYSVNAGNVTGGEC